MAKSPLPGAPAASKHLCEETVMDDHAGTPADPEWIKPGRTHFIFGKEPKTPWTEHDSVLVSHGDDED